MAARTKARWRSALKFHGSRGITASCQKRHWRMMLVVPAAALASKHPGKEFMPKLTQSYVHGVSMTPLIGETIGTHFDKMAARFADRDALIVRQQNIRWTYGELKEKTDALAAGLLALGLEPGERVGIWSPNNAEWVVTQFATAKAGLILVNVNPAYRLAELEYALNKSGCVALITASRFKSSDYIGMLRDLAPELETAAPGNLHAAKLPELRLIITIGADSEKGM